MLAGCSSWSAATRSVACVRTQLAKTPATRLFPVRRPFASSPPPSGSSPTVPPASSTASDSSSLAAPPPPSGPASPTELTTTSSSSVVVQPSYAEWATLAETNDPSLPADAFPDPALPPQPRNAPKYQPLRHTIPLEAQDVYLAPTLDPAIQPPPHFSPPHPFLFLSIRDSLVPNKWRNNPLPPFPRPVVVPIYPAPVLKPTDPRPDDAPSTIKYQPLSPEQLADLYDKRITRRARPDKQHDNWIHRMMDSWDKEPDDPEGWQGVRLRLGMPAYAANRPPSLQWRWEALEEEDLWKIVMPMFYLSAAIPILGGFGVYLFDIVYMGRWEDEVGNFRFK